MCVFVETRLLDAFESSLSVACPTSVGLMSTRLMPIGSVGFVLTTGGLSVDWETDGRRCSESWPNDARDFFLLFTAGCDRFVELYMVSTFLFGLEFFVTATAFMVLVRSSPTRLLETSYYVHARRAPNNKCYKTFQQQTEHVSELVFLPWGHHGGRAYWREAW